MTNNSNETQIRTLIESWTKAVREGDMEGVIAHHTDDIVIFDVPRPLQSKGTEAYKKMWELFFSYQPKGDFDLSELEITADDTVALVTAFSGLAAKKNRRYVSPWAFAKFATSG